MRKKLLVFMYSIFLISFSGNPLIESALAEERHGHRAHHGGVLNVIGEEAGHIEIRLQEDNLQAWFVGGGHDTHLSVPIKAAEIPLTVSVPGKAEMESVLKADPMKLAGEKIGHCSHFVAKADWLRDVKKFEARGEVEFKGIRHKLLIKYPEGYDPMHKPGAK